MSDQFAGEDMIGRLSSSGDISLALAATETRLMRALNAGLAQVTAAIAALTEMHHKAILEQERRNASFATQERLDSLAHRVDELNAALSARTARLEHIEAGMARLDRETADLQSQLTARSVSILSSATGYLVTALLLVGSNLLTFLLAHAVH